MSGPRNPRRRGVPDAAQEMQDRKVILRRWKCIGEAVQQIIAVADWASEQRRSLVGLARVAPHVLRLCPPLLSFMKATSGASTETAGQTTTKTNAKTEQAQYETAAVCCNHASSAKQPDPIKRYKDGGFDWELCQSCGSRWVTIRDRMVPMPPSPAPGKPPRTTSKQYLGELVHEIGEHRGKKIKDLPVHYLRWALEVKAPGNKLFLVVAYAMFAKIGEATAVPSASSEGSPPRATKQRSTKRADPTEKWSHVRSHRDPVESDSANEQEVETEPALTQSEDDETDQ